MHDPIPDRTEKVASQVIEAAFQVHRALGPGLLESVYETCLCHELTKMGLKYQRQLPVPIRYDEIVLESGLRLDVYVEECVIVELRSVETMIPLFHAQLLSHLRLRDQRLGLLINLNVKLLKDGIQRIAN